MVSVVEPASGGVMPSGDKVDNAKGDAAQSVADARTVFDEDGVTFLLALRHGWTWDTTSFGKVVRAMYEHCLATGTCQDDLVRRDIAHWYWYFQMQVRHYAEKAERLHGVSRPRAEGAAALLDDLAYWYFTGDTPYPDPDVVLRRVESWSEVENNE